MRGRSSALEPSWVILLKNGTLNQMNKLRSIKLFQGIGRNIFILGFVSFFTDLSSQMVFPLIPLFLTTVLGAGACAVGIIEGAAEATASLVKVSSGFVSDKFKRRKPFILFGYSLSTITKPLFAFASAWSFVLFIRVIERIGKGLRTAPRDAIVAESCDGCVRGKAFAFHRTMDGIGSVLGAVLAFLLLPVLGYRNIFLLALVPGVISVLIIFFIKEKNSSKENERVVKLGFKEFSRDLRLFIIVSAVFALGHFGYAFLLLRAQNIGLADNTAILLYILFYVVYSLCSIPSGIISDKVGRKAVLFSGYLLFGLISLGLALSSNFNGVLIFFALYGVFYAMIDGVQRAFVVDLAPAHLKATALGTFHAAIGLVALPGGYFAGLLWDKINPEATFLFGFTLAILSILLFVFVREKN